MGGVRAGRHRPGDAARHSGRRVRRHQRPGLSRPRRQRGGGAGGSARHRHRRQRGLRPSLVHLRSGGPGRDGRHGVLVLAGRAALGDSGAAQRRVHDGARRWRDRDVHAGRFRGVQPSARPGRRRPLQAVRGGGRRHRLGRGRRHAARGAAVGRAAQRSPGPRGRPWQRRQPGRRQQRSDGPQRSGPAARHPPGPGRRPPVGGRGGRGRGARHRHHAGRPDRGSGAAGHLRAAPGRSAAVARLDQVQHRPHPGRRRRRGHHQDGAGHAPRRAPAEPARRHPEPARRLVDGCGGGADRGARLARDRPPAPGGRVVLRRERHQRPCGAGAGPGRRVRRDARPGVRLGAVPAGPLGPHRAGAARAGGAAAFLHRGRAGDPTRGPGLLAGDRPCRSGAPGRRGRRGRSGVPGGS